MQAECSTRSAQAAIVRALESAPRLGSEEPAIVITVPVRASLTASEAYRRFAEATGGPRVLWETPGSDWSFAGSGETWRFDAAGPDRFGRTRGAAEAWLRDVRAWTHPGCDAPAPRLFGGFAFRTGEPRSGPWRGFADASFAMPRWLYGRSGDRAILRLTIDRDELPAREALLREAARVTEALERRGGVDATVRPGSARACVATMSPATWMGLVAGALEKIRARDIEKVVTAMHGQVLSPQPIDVAALLARMSAEYGDCVRFSFSRASATFVGATPERLVVQSGLDVEVDALAGSARRVSPGGDDAVVMGLLASEKDRREHAHVVDAVTCALLPLCRVLEVPSVPRVRSLRNVHHLWSPVHATRARAGHVLDLVERLHPTPAVCGTPREAALGWIATFEPMQRGWYAGAVGWFDGTGDGAFAVAIRSGVIERHRAWLYAGAGIVEGSDPEVEYAEVRTKQAPMLSALGVLP